MLKRRYIAGLEVQGRSIRGRVLRYLDEATIQTGFGQKRERFARGAFGDVSALDVTLDLQHAPERRIARTRGGGLELRQSGDDILLEATLPATRDADDCLALVRSGVLRGFSVEFTAAAVSPAILHQIGRDLVLSGQSVLQFGVMPGGPTLRRPAEYDLVGSPDPATWAYRLRYIGPSRDSTAPGTVADVVHIRLNEDARAPHCGVSPILAAADTAGALAGLERALKLEANATSGYVIPSASAEGMDDDSFTALKSDLAKLAGATRIVPSLGPRPGDPQGRSGDADWKAQRIGLNPPQSVVELRTSAGLGVMAAAGIPLPMVSERADATALREALRQFVHVTLQPVLRIVGAELSRVLELEVNLDLAPLAAADVQGRARAFRALVGNGTTPGLDVAEARRLTGMD